MSGVFERVYDTVRQIPCGRVTTYGMVARLTGVANARTVGFALNALPIGTDVPWQRVINAKGTISERHRERTETNRQHDLLAAEGIAFDPAGRIDLAGYGWSGPPSNAGISAEE
ncbi:MAG: MGMT family protein [Candidatus Sericytochromatia bacterium]|nr:MGMT family protein [Candidatus Sericytochromatia bacterium]